MDNNLSNENQESFISKNKNLFFIIVSVILFLFASFLIYKSLDSLGLFEKKEAQIKPQNVQQLVQIEVLNGCGVAGVGDKFTDVIRKKGFDVVNTGNYISFDIDKTFIIDRLGNIETAYRVADSLDIDKKLVINQINKNYFLDLTIVVGKDYTNYLQ